MKRLEGGAGAEGTFDGSMASQLVLSMVDGAEEAARGYERQCQATSMIETGGAQLDPIFEQGEPSDMEVWLFELTNGLLPPS